MVGDCRRDEDLFRWAASMSFNPRSDVILEVMKAADPGRAQAAAERLQALGAGAPAVSFAADLDRVSTASPLPPAGLADARSSVLAAGPDSAPRVKVEFEAMLINSFVGEMLPKNAAGVFGEGTAGDIWRSMLSEQIARQIARSGALGLSRRLFATHDVEPRAVTDHAAEAVTATLASANPLSASSAADIANGVVLSSSRKGA